MTTTEDEFNVALCLFLLGTILSPSATDYVPVGYLIPLTDVGSISRTNWSNWCFTSLYEGIQKFHMNRHRMKTSCISGCVLFLQIKKCLIRLHNEGGVGSNQDIYNQPSAPGGQYDVGSHGRTDHANEDPGTSNNGHIKGIDDVLRVVKVMQLH
ncbi:hypothetical protein Ddye_023151 [Dipteronia dyeriana]|uniref:Uncharacterized protein n=1 Tax=Dipteronia dyeriana TaxID=168575 RepID=A0AAD9WSZ2_9ROSI|nr:hypothetical protein Ddye_023151 [Dipteronia dyeriana]